MTDAQRAARLAKIARLSEARATYRQESTARPLSHDELEEGRAIGQRAGADWVARACGKVDY